MDQRPEGNGAWFSINIAILNKRHDFSKMLRGLVILRDRGTRFRSSASTKKLMQIEVLYISSQISTII